MGFAIFNIYEGIAKNDKNGEKGSGFAGPLKAIDMYIYKRCKNAMKCKNRSTPGTVVAVTIMNVSFSGYYLNQ